MLFISMVQIYWKPKLPIQIIPSRKTTCQRMSAVISGESCGKTPKNIHYSSSGTLSYKVAACVAQKNSGHTFLVSVIPSLGLSPGFYTNRLAKLRDSKHILSRELLQIPTSSRKKD